MFILNKVDTKRQTKRRCDRCWYRGVWLIKSGLEKRCPAHYPDPQLIERFLKDFYRERVCL